MNPVLMRAWQNALAIVAGFLVAGALLPWDADLRLMCSFAAIGIVLLLLVFRLRAHARAASTKRTSDVYGRVARIRSAREDRLKRRTR